MKLSIIIFLLATNLQSSSTPDLQAELNCINNLVECDEKLLLQIVSPENSGKLKEVFEKAIAEKEKGLSSQFVHQKKMQSEMENKIKWGGPIGALGVFFTRFPHLLSPQNPLLAPTIEALAELYRLGYYLAKLYQPS